jgi:hypothetical protein
MDGPCQVQNLEAVVETGCAISEKTVALLGDAGAEDRNVNPEKGSGERSTAWRDRSVRNAVSWQATSVDGPARTSAEAV